jgi:hypothetical protein
VVWPAETIRAVCAQPYLPVGHQVVRWAAQLMCDGVAWQAFAVVKDSLRRSSAALVGCSAAADFKP